MFFSQFQCARIENSRMGQKLSGARAIHSNKMRVIKCRASIFAINPQCAFAAAAHDTWGRVRPASACLFALQCGKKL